MEILSYSGAVTDFEGDLVVLGRFEGQDPSDAENKINAQNVGVEVEKESKKVVDWALRLVYGSIIPNEISEIFGTETNETFEHKDIEELAGEVNAQ